MRAPDEVVRVYTGAKPVVVADLSGHRARSEVFTDVAAHAGATRMLNTDDSTARLSGETTSTNYLTMLGVPAHLGRTYLPSDSRADVVVLAERTWRTQFASDPSIVGRRITARWTRVRSPRRHAAWFPRRTAAGIPQRVLDPNRSDALGRTLQDRTDDGILQIAARLKPGMTVAQAQAATQVIGQQLARSIPISATGSRRPRSSTAEGIDGFRGMTKTLLPLFAFVGLLTVVAGLVLLVGCANIAGLLLGRGASRRREIGVRLALGAGRARLIRQLLTESLLLALLGGSAGLLLAFWLGGSMNALVSRLPVPIELDLSLDRRMMIYTLTLSLVTAVLCGLAPARRATRMSVIPALKDDESMPHRQRMRSLAGGGSGRPVLRAAPLERPLRQELANAQGGRSRLRTRRRRHRTNSVRLRMPFAASAIAPLLDSLQSHLQAFPGVQSQGMATIVPLALMGREETRMRLDTDPADQRGPMVLVNRVSPGWFRTVQIPLLAGRDF